ALIATIAATAGRTVNEVRLSTEARRATPVLLASGACSVSRIVAPKGYGAADDGRIVIERRSAEIDRWTGQATVGPGLSRSTTMLVLFTEAGSISLSKVTTSAKSGATWVAFLPETDVTVGPTV